MIYKVDPKKFLGSLLFLSATLMGTAALAVVAMLGPDLGLLGVFGVFLGSVISLGAFYSFFGQGRQIRARLEREGA